MCIFNCLVLAYLEILKSFAKASVFEDGIFSGSFWFTNLVAETRNEIIYKTDEVKNT
jgi:hypothetical protein